MAQAAQARPEHRAHYMSTVALAEVEGSGRRAEPLGSPPGRGPSVKK